MPGVGVGGLPQGKPLIILSGSQSPQVGHRQDSHIGQLTPTPLSVLVKWNA